MKTFNRAHEMFNDMMQFAIAHGIECYHSDLMHDAVTLTNIDDAEEPAVIIWVVKGNGCGTWMWNTTTGGSAPDFVTNDSGAKVELKYDGNVWTFNEL
jgi:hypothetical protein